MENESTDLIPGKIEVSELVVAEKMDALLTEIRRRALAEPQDISTPAGRKACASQAYKVARSKTYIDDILKAHIADKKAQIKAFDAKRKHAVDFLVALKDEVRAPLDAYEEAEKAKAAAEKLAEEIAQDHELALEMNASIDQQKELARQSDEMKRQKEELDRREAELLRAEREKQIREEAAEKAKAAAEKKAEADRRELVEREASAKEALVWAESRIKAEQEAKAKEVAAAIAETERKAREAAEKEAAMARAAEADTANRARVIKVVTDCLVAKGIPAGIASVVVGLIATGKIAHTKIDFQQR